MVAPIIPAINEMEVPAILRVAARTGAVTARSTVLRTNGAVEQGFIRWPGQHYPDHADKVLAQTRSLYGGPLSESRPGIRMKGPGGYAANISRMFQVMRRRYFGDARFPELDGSDSTFRDSVS